MKRRSIGRLLRSRRLAVWLLAIACLWAFVGTTIPESVQEAAESGAGPSADSLAARVVSVLGLDHPYSHPVFLGLIMVLLLSTTLCAWERTRWVARAWRTLGKTGERGRHELETCPAIRESVSAEADAAEVMRVVEAEMLGLGLAVSRESDAVEAASGRWSVFGSPVFHWSLALLIVVVALGRLSRSEGLLGVPVGGSLPDVAESYGRVDEGPLFAGHTDLEIAVLEMERAYVTPDGVDRGAAPVVALRDSAGSEIARGRVYPNSPLRHGVTMIHFSDYGLSPAVALYGPGGENLGSVRPIMDFVEGSSRSTTAVVDLLDERGSVFEVHLAGTGGVDAPLLAVAVIDSSSGALLFEDELAVGEGMPLPAGDELVFEATGLYARLAVSHDWSVYPMYALFAIGLLGVSVAVLSPYRRVRVLFVGEGANSELRAILRHGRGSALFESQVREALARAATVLAEGVVRDA